MKPTGGGPWVIVLADHLTHGPLPVGFLLHTLSMNDERRWFHLIVTTYGAWLYGDPRGFRTRHHREHVEGDYKNPPPPGKYADKEARSRRLLKQPPVVIPAEWRQKIGEPLRDKLRTLGAMVLCVSVSGQHAHLLAKMPPGRIPRKWVGQAKKHAKFLANEAGWTGKLWAVGSKPEPVNDRKHQLNVFNYILRHAEQGAWVWDFRTEQQPPPESPGTAVPGLSTPDSPAPNES